jgi:hypothetical protein
VSFNLSKIDPDQPDKVKKREAKREAKNLEKKYYKKVGLCAAQRPKGR